MACCEYQRHGPRVSPQTPRDPPNFRDCHYAPGVSKNTDSLKTREVLERDSKHANQRILFYFTFWGLTGTFSGVYRTVSEHTILLYSSNITSIVQWLRNKDPEIKLCHPPVVCSQNACTEICWWDIERVLNSLRFQHISRNMMSLAKLASQFLRFWERSNGNGSFKMFAITCIWPENLHPFDLKTISCSIHPAAALLSFQTMRIVTALAVKARMCPRKSTTNLGWGRLNRRSDSPRFVDIIKHVPLKCRNLPNHPFFIAGFARCPPKKHAPEQGGLGVSTPWFFLFRNHPFWST